MQLGIEIWEDIYGYEGLYQISNFGRVKSLKRIVSGGVTTWLKPEKILHQATNIFGYKYVALHKNGKQTTSPVHRMVIETFVDKIEGKNVCNHNNGIKACNYSWNLKLATQSENIKHAFDIGIKESVKGEKHPRSKLKEPDVINIRQLFKDGKYNQIEFGKIFGVASPIISQIVNYKLWKHI